ncbi:MAG TPA: nitroreductase family deazaflavin-dependent oxidoreductase [Anaerolineales bacterium]|nr:nitroreductase family deazaflavin-dependent oxidoreductase [Anaerolineales bacterium]
MSKTQSNAMNSLLPSLAEESYCYLTTIGRVSGNPHEIEIWFGARGNTLYLLSGGMDKSDWVKNLLKTPAVTVRVGKQTFKATARLVEDKQEEMMARNLLADKYNERNLNGSLGRWARSALPVAIDLILNE